RGAGGEVARGDGDVRGAVRGRAGCVEQSAAGGQVVQDELDRARDRRRAVVGHRDVLVEAAGGAVRGERALREAQRAERVEQVRRAGVERVERVQVEPVLDGGKDGR